MSDRIDLDDCGADLHRWWINFEREFKERQERENKRAKLVTEDDRKDQGNGNSESSN